MAMKTITILTPTYNRRNYLGKLYESLCGQTCMDFCWLVVDDGSTDGTVGQVQGWMQESKVEIGLLSKPNGGKHTALNMGIGQVRTELTFIVDSDDYLPKEAVRTILEYHRKYRGQKDRLRLCGYSFLRCYSNGEVNTAYFRKEEEVATYLQVRINGNIGGDKAEAFYTDILKKYPFPEIAGEKFLAEDVVWMRMSGPYQMVHINQCVYICDYLEEGLTKTGRRMKIHSPKGMMLRSQVYLEHRRVCLKVRIKMMLLYIIYGRFDGNAFHKLFRSVGRGRFLFLLAYLPASLIYEKWKRE